MQVEKHPPQAATEKISKKYGWNFAIHVLLDYYIQDISIFGIESVPPISVHFWAPSPTCISAANSSSASSTSNSLALFAPTSCASRGYQSWWTPEMTPRRINRLTKSEEPCFHHMLSLHLHRLSFVSRATTSQAPVLPQVKPSLVACARRFQMTASLEWVLGKSEIGMGQQNWA